MIRTDWDEIGSRKHDLVIVGGGIQGVCLLHAAARAGVPALLVERDDYGGGATANSLRILHGGLRYLQSADLLRFRASIAARRAVLSGFPDLAHPMDFVMPLAGNGLRRRSLVRAALTVNRLLAAVFDPGARAGAPTLRGGRLVTPGGPSTATPWAAWVPAGPAAVWQEAVLPVPGRLLVRMLRDAIAAGAAAANYVEATGLGVANGRVRAVHLHSRIDGRELEVSAPIVCVCAGASTGTLLRGWKIRAAREMPVSLAFNLLLAPRNVPPCGLALPGTGAAPDVRIVYPAIGGLLAGTAHVPCDPQRRWDAPSPEQVVSFRRDLEERAPWLGPGDDDVVRVFWGHLPVVAEGTLQLARRAAVTDFGRAGGPEGLHSVQGVKLTESPAVAACVMRRLFPQSRPAPTAPVPASDAEAGLDCDSPSGLLALPSSTAVDRICRLIAAEDVVQREDLFERRTNWGYYPAHRAALESLWSLATAAGSAVVRSVGDGESARA